MRTRGARESLLVAQLYREPTDTTALALANTPLDRAKLRGICAALRVNGRFGLRIGVHALCSMRQKRRETHVERPARDGSDARRQQSLKEAVQNPTCKGLTPRAQREPWCKGIQTEFPSNADVSLTTLQARSHNLSA